RRSLVIMKESSRYDYKHSISKDLVEYLFGTEIVRARRISITFRDILVERRQQDDGDRAVPSVGNSCNNNKDDYDE
ncbi:hypothetical protein BGZ98_003123, partial [Dissophora globulifera]